MTDHGLHGRRTMGYLQHRQLQQVTLERLRTQADRSHELMTKSQHLLGLGRGTWTMTQHRIFDGDGKLDASSLASPAEGNGEREAIARQRLLEWEATDLSEIVPGEMDTPRRRFALSLYEMIAVSQSMGMTEDRLVYHLRAALQRYQSGE